MESTIALANESYWGGGGHAGPARPAPRAAAFILSTAFLKSATVILRDVKEAPFAAFAASMITFFAASLGDSRRIPPRIRKIFLDFLIFECLELRRVVLFFILDKRKEIDIKISL